MSVEQMNLENKLATVIQSTASVRSSAKITEGSKTPDIVGSEDNSLVKLNEQETKTVQQAQKEAQLQTQKEQEIDKVKVEQDVQSLNDLFPLKNTNLIFEFDKLGEPPVIKVVDQSNKEVIREIPPKDLAKLSKALQDLADSYSKSGALFNSEV